MRGGFTALLLVFTHTVRLCAAEGSQLVSASPCTYLCTQNNNNSNRHVEDTDKLPLSRLGARSGKTEQLVMHSACCPAGWTAAALSQKTAQQVCGAAPQQPFARRSSYFDQSLPLAQSH